MKTLIATAALALTVAAPAFADTSFAVAQNNAGIDNGDRIVLQEGAALTTVSTRSVTSDLAVEINNGSIDNGDVVVGQGHFAASVPSFAADKFALEAEASEES